MRSRTVFPAAACLTLLALALPAPAQAETTVHADLVEQNRSGVTGTVTLTARDNGDLVVRITATGLMPGPHAQHIHGATGGGSFSCASAGNDDDGDGWLTNEEASGEYGNVFVALTTSGNTAAESGLDLDRMPVADSEGRLTYERTIRSQALPAGLTDELQHVHVVQHGIDANDNGRYDLEALGESTFATGLGLSGVPEEATNPAACGMVMGAAAGVMPHGGVETGGEPPAPSTSGPLLALGIGMLALAAVVGLRRRSALARR
jgi:hypothetical protein